MAEYTFVIEDRATFDEVIVQRGLDADNIKQGFRPFDELAAFVRDDEGQVLGGVCAELGWNWLYIDLLWMDDRLRGQGYGGGLMAAIEQAGLARGVQQVYVATTSFQARPFYEKCGYTVFAMLEDRPPGHQYYYLKKPITPAAPPADLVVTDDPSPEDLKAVRAGLSGHSNAQGITRDARRLAVFLQDDAQSVRGGLVGATYWGWLDIQALWVDDSLRGQGHGRRLLALAEEEAIKRGYYKAFADVSEFQALGFFRKYGYSTFGTLPERPRGYATHFLRKQLLA